MDRFPDEIVSEIVHHLHQQEDLFLCTQINRLFYDIAKPLLWKTPHIQKLCSLKRLFASLERPVREPMGKYIETIELQDQFWNDLTFLNLMKHLNKLKSLSISSKSRVTITSIQDLPIYCPGLISLDLERSTTTEVVINALTYLDSLRHLTLSRFRDLPWNIFSALRMTSLETLTINATSIDGSRTLDNPLRHNDLPTLQHLTNLSIRGGNGSSIRWLFTFRPDNDDTPFWPSLSRIELGSCNEIDDDVFISFIQLLPRLVEIQLHECPKITDISMDAIATSLPGIVSITLYENSYITHDAICRLIGNCHKLTSLKIYEDSKEVEDKQGKYVELHQNKINAIRQESTNRSDID